MIVVRVGGEIANESVMCHAGFLFTCVELIGEVDFLGGCRRGRSVEMAEILFGIPHQIV